MSVLWRSATGVGNLWLRGLGPWVLDGLPLLEVWEFGHLQSVSEEIEMRAVKFGDKAWEWDWWNGEVVKGTLEAPASLDTETALIKTIRPPREGEGPTDPPLDPRDIPKLSVGMVFDGEKLYAIHPSKFQQFLLTNRARPLCGQNIQFDFWVLHKHCGPAGKEALWTLAERGLLKCTQTLDLLLQLATGKYRHAGGGKGDDDAKLFPTNLGVLAKEWEVGEVNKGDEYRLRFGELVGLTEEEIDNHPERDGFFGYAFPDVLSTYEVYRKQRVYALELMTKAGWSPKPQKLYEMRPDCVQKWDVLSLDIQVRASITLAELSRTPIRIDQVKRKELEEAARQRYRGYIQTMMELEPEIVHRYKPKKYIKVDGERVLNPNTEGELKVNKSTGFPKLNDKVLKFRLQRESEQLGILAPVSKGKNKAISKSAKDWEPWKEESTFLAAFCGQASEQKLMAFFLGLQSDTGEVFTRYDLLKRSGRTSANQWKYKKELVLPSVNVQQIPRENEDHPERDVRQLFLASPKHKWLAVDYSAIELSTLAAACVARFGYSKMRDGIVAKVNGGPDLHQVMAAAINKMPVEEFLQLPEKVQKTKRKEAKAVSFGFPGGMGVDKFCMTAAKQGIHFTKKQASEAKKVWFETFPEMKEHLADSTQMALSWQSGVSPKKIPTLSWLQRRRYGDFLKGKVKLTTGEDDDFWDLVEGLGWQKGDEELVADAQQRVVTPRVKRLFEYRACTLTGRVRNNVTFSSGKNAVFQGIASDGAKEGIFRLMRRGFRLLMFIHDEICFDIPAYRVEVDRKQIEKIMVDSMSAVIAHGVPVSVESGVADRWHKG